MSAKARNSVGVGQLSQVPATLLIPLWCRSEETKRRKPIVQDPHAVKMVAQIQFDFQRFHSWSGRLTQVAVASRTVLIDHALKRYLRDHPSGLVLNLGCGLDARCLRMDNGSIHWVDIDVPSSLAVRRSFFEENDRYQLLEGSLLEDTWFKQIHFRYKGPVFAIAEGLFMYFHEDVVKALFQRMVTYFRSGYFCMEVLGPALKGTSHPMVKQLGVETRFPWGLRDFKRLESWDSRIKFLRSATVYDRYLWRYGVVGVLMGCVPFLKTYVGSNIVVYQFE